MTTLKPTKNYKWPERVGREETYFEIRHCFIDLRGTLIIHPKTYWGWQISVYTQKHPLTKGEFVAYTSDAPVIIKEGAQIYSNAVLSDCTIGEYAVVGAGAVVVGRDVEPHTLVVGNPARAIKRWNGEKWERIMGEITDKATDLISTIDCEILHKLDTEFS